MRLLATSRALNGTRLLACVALGIQVLHVICLLSLANPLPLSDCLQLTLPVLVVAGCLAKRSSLLEIRDRRTWSLLAFSFAIWSLAETCYLLEVRYSSRGALSSIDDVLWLLFAVPLLLVVSGSLEGNLNWIRWLDQVQAFVFFVVVAILVYGHPSALTFNRAYSIQNVALLLSCSLRYSAAESQKDRKLFGRLALYLLVYLLCSGIGNGMAHRGWEPGSPVDLFWTLPLTAFCVFVVTIEPDEDSGWSEQRNAGELTGYLHDLSALGLAALSMGSSVYLAMHWKVPGSFCLALSFVFFSIRTCGRERELHRINRRLRDSVLEDALTGLGNRARLRESLSTLLNGSAPAKHPKGTTAVLFIDLDRFKSINDSLGHESGDKILREVARRIKRACETGGIPCRLGGDEFVVVLHGELAEAAENFARAVLCGIRDPIHLGVKVLQISGSIGVAITRGEAEPDELLRKADHAMYRAKRLGKDRIELCDSRVAAVSAN